MKSLLLLTIISGYATLWSADQIFNNIGVPASNVPFVSNMSVDEAQRWYVFSQVVPIKENSSIVLDTMEAKNTLLVVHSINYFKGTAGQIFAIVNYLRPREAFKTIAELTEENKSLKKKIADLESKISGLNAK